MSRKYDRAQMAVLRRERVEKTSANGGVAPCAVHNYVTYCTWGCRCSKCEEGWRSEKNRRRQVGTPGRLRRADIPVQEVADLHEQGMSETALSKLFGCSRDCIRTRLLHAKIGSG